ncbi:MAG: LysM peptidoglycan-binding domain-containing protein [Bacteroidales bacterium]
MECPVCKTTGLPEETRNCPQCNAYLEALHLLKNIEKSNKKRFNFGIVMLALLVLVITAWIITLSLSRNSGKAIENIAEVEKFSNLKTELETTKNEVLKLKTENKQLTEQMAQIETVKSGRVETYIVKEGETLFSIARRVYGNGYKYVDLAKENSINAADSIVVGQELKIHY